MPETYGPLFDKYARFYNLIYRDRDTPAEVSWILSELNTAVPLRRCMSTPSNPTDPSTFPSNTTHVQCI